MFGNNVDSTSAIGDLVLPSLTNKRRDDSLQRCGSGATTENTKENAGSLVGSRTHPN